MYGSDMAAFNAALKKLPSCLFDQFIAEGNDITRDAETFQFIRNQMNKNGEHFRTLVSKLFCNGVTVDGIYSPKPRRSR